MTNPFLPQQQPAAPAPAQPAANPYAQQPAAPVAPPAPQHYTQQPQQAPANPYGAPASNGGTPWPAGAAAGAPGGTALVATPGGFQRPAPPDLSGGGKRPRLLDLYGRLLLILPESKTDVPSKFLDAQGRPKMQPRLTATVIVLDGGPLSFGGEPEKGPMGKGQHTEHVEVPYVIKGMWINQTKIIEQTAEALAMRLRGEPGLSLGRLWKIGQQQNDPWVLAEPTPEDAAVYDRYVSQVNPFTL